MEPLVTSTFSNVVRTPNGDVVVYERTAAPYPSATAVDEDFAQLRAAVHDLSLFRTGLLIDLTAIRGRNDGTFEHAIAPHRAWMFNSFGAVALVVRSEIGRLQVRRHLREDGHAHPVFLDRQRALTWLAAKVGSARRSAENRPAGG